MGKRKRISRKGLKHDALLETAAKSSKFIEHNLNRIAVGVIVVIVAFVAVGLVFRSRRATEAAASGELATASQAMNAGLTADAAARYRSVIDTYPGSRAAGAATCYLGTIRFSEGRFDEALDLFDTYLARWGREGNLASVALEGRAAILEQRRDFPGAAGVYAELADRAPPESRERTRYLAAQIRLYRSADDWLSVQTLARIILDETPNAPEAADARVALAEASARLES